MSGERSTRIGARPPCARVRPARAEDLDAIVAIERGAFSDPWSPAAFRALLARRDAHFVVADGAAGRAAAGGQEGLPAGVLGYAVAWFVVGEGEVANIAVHPECRGRGVGASLLDDVLRTARQQGVTTVFLEVRESNAPARALYASRGFRQVGRRRSYYRRPTEDALLLRWDRPEPGASAP